MNVKYVLKRGFQTNLENTALKETEWAWLFPLKLLWACEWFTTWTRRPLAQPIANRGDCWGVAVRVSFAFRKCY